MNLNRLKAHIRIELQASPGDPVVRSLPANAGDTDGIPSPGGCHMPQSDWAPVMQLRSLCAGTQEQQLLTHTLQLLRSVPWSPCSARGGAPTSLRIATEVWHPTPSSKIEKSLRSSKDPAQSDRQNRIVPFGLKHTNQRQKSAKLKAN